MKILTCYEDTDTLVIHKPAGIVVNRAKSVKVDTIQDWIESQKWYPKELQENELDMLYRARSGMAHRIDKDTSGALLIAKNPQSLSSLLKQFKNRSIEKSYRALVYDAVFPQEGTINAPIGRLPWNRERFGVFAGGKDALTKYKVIGSYTREKHIHVTYLELYPRTGRTHQIRVHLQYMHHPIVADALYSGRKHYKRDKVWMPRMFLHAYSIAFDQPTSDTRIQVTCELSADLLEALKTLTKNTKNLSV